jgi:hypothetical protein
MTAAQSSLNANRRTLFFAGLTHEVLFKAGYDVFVKDPGLEWTLDDLEEYSAVIVGVSPLMSLSAHKAYGALNVIELLWNDPRLHLLIDSPNPAQIRSNLKSVSSNSENLTKPFHSFRQGYQLARTESVSKRLLGTVDRLLNDPWPATMYPSLPWRDASSIADKLPDGASQDLRGISLDAFLIATKPREESEEKILKWVADDYKATWTKKVAKTLSLPVLPMKYSRGEDDVLVGTKIARSIGALITPQRDGTWWSSRYAQSIDLGVPVATDWKESQRIGSSWSVLPASIEHMDAEARRRLATAQRNEYLQAIGNRETARKNLEATLGLRANQRKEVHAV